MRTKGHHTQQRVGWVGAPIGGKRVQSERPQGCGVLERAIGERGAPETPFDSESLQNAPFAKIARFEQLVALFEPLVGAVNKATRTAR